LDHRLEQEGREPDPDAWLRSWRLLVEHRQRVVDVGDWTVERTQGGGYEAWRRVKKVGVSVGERGTDAVLLNVVNTGLAIAGVRSKAIEVSVKGGVVRLAGPVASAEQAGEAIRVALGTQGVERVVSRMSWPRS